MVDILVRNVDEEDRPPAEGKGQGQGHFGERHRARGAQSRREAKQGRSLGRNRPHPCENRQGIGQFNEG